ncbi:hypothetical protein, variant [Aphanomyces invadans]|uniref:Uncharacterized protein n=1 Tax=Aphanomyces invadans TaxID=157072 RepID=A0A024U2V8_9STRA|nr:hypothetical protein H310_07937 [Aphanomyces invadans]XP_008871683.1 hypothetical protein, variant [Aphanomyces invadans]ETV99906.1 hypothetical protein H310_07937 [Aphanomyces invadans]ETV99907.1 hypothetical protein, variant [Aphanomyces invadans]|eukprot:XP_008871682.1 hypothetical protein H310_07937 [Aphanomyces invadans]
MAATSNVDTRLNVWVIGWSPLARSCEVKSCGRVTRRCTVGAHTTALVATQTHICARGYRIHRRDWTRRTRASVAVRGSNNTSVIANFTTMMHWLKMNETPPTRRRALEITIRVRTSIASPLSKHTIGGSARVYAAKKNAVTAAKPGCLYLIAEWLLRQTNMTSAKGR